MWKKGHEGEIEGESPGQGSLRAYKASLGGENPLIVSESSIWSSILQALKPDFSAPLDTQSLVNAPSLAKPHSSLTCKPECKYFFHNEAGNPLSVTKMINYTTYSISFPKILIRMWLY